MPPDPDFAILAGDPDPPVEELALALAAAFREIDREGARARLDRLGEQLAALLGGEGAGAEAEAWACAELLGGRHGLSGDRDDYDNPDNSMLDLVLERRRGLPIALSVVYVAAARRAGIPLAGVGLPGHFVVAHFGASPPLVLDPFGGGVRVEVQPGAERLVRPWHPHETALRMLNNLVAGYARRARLDDALVAARLRLALPVPDAERVRLEEEMVALQARLN
jgi:regulator of sirC expression with transglutaminase-like and TPR domain